MNGACMEPPLLFSFSDRVKPRTLYPFANLHVMVGIFFTFVCDANAVDEIKSLEALKS